MSLNIKNIILKADDKGFFTIHAEERLWQQDKQIRPLIRRQAGDLYFDQASSIITTPFETGLGRGLRTLYKGFEGENTAFETLVWVEEATGHLHCEFVPLALDQALSVQWPSPFMADEAGSYAALTHLQGYLLPVDWPEEGPQLPFGGQMCSCGAYMPWFGEVTTQGGYLCYVRQPWDSAYECRHPAGGPTRMLVKHLPSLGKMEGSRQLTYVFTPAGSDYVTLCKVYRGFAEEAGLAVTLREKQMRCASLSRLIGSSVLHVEVKSHVTPDSAYYDRENPEKNDSLHTFDERAALVERLTKEGVGRMYLHLDGWGEPGYDNKHPDYLPPCEAAGGWEGLKRLIDTCRKHSHLFGLHDQYRDYYLDAPTYDPDNAVTLADGTVFEMARWAGGRQNYLCSQLAPDYVRRNYTQLFENGIDIDCVYLDVFTCNEPDECINPRHRVTRRQSLDYRLRCLDYMLARGILPSSEEAADWALPALVFCHWAPYTKMGIPTPLYNLVYHDCLMIPWMLGKGTWGTPEGQPGFLHAMLNAGMGYVDDKLTGSELQENFARLRIVSALQKRLAYEQMTGHRFLSDDKSIQQTSFSDGTVVTVDFKEETCRVEPPLVL